MDTDDEVFSFWIEAYFGVLYWRPDPFMEHRLCMLVLQLEALKEQK